jgi:ribosomal protein S18 acetylase RimI-like enzyme
MHGRAEQGDNRAMRIESLTSSDLQTPEAWSLLGLATGYDDSRLRSVRDEQLPDLNVLGTKDEGLVRALTAYRIADSAVVVEYIATAEQLHGKGIGRSMIETIRCRHPLAIITAETDDDAVGFYRSLGFHTRPVRNPRSPERPRYECTLPV